jgi:hypothetical protein
VVVAEVVVQGGESSIHLGKKQAQTTQVNCLEIRI